jgi:hypothetical protein
MASTDERNRRPFAIVLAISLCLCLGGVVLSVLGDSVPRRWAIS